MMRPNGTLAMPTDGYDERAWHEYWLAMDARYRTDKLSPLHHDNRCEYCKKGSK